MPDPGAAPQFVVKGQVRHSDGNPVPGLIVIAVDQDLRGQQTLGQPATTDQDGQYAITYTAADFNRAEKATADLIVYVKIAGPTPSGPPIDLVNSGPPLFNAPQTATINLTVPGTNRAVPSEYDRLIAELQPLLVNVTIAGVPSPTTIDQLADLKTDDIDFLVGETGEPRTKLEAVVRAAVLQKLSAATSTSTAPAAIPAPIFYGLAREGLPLDLAALLKRSVAELQAALTQALQQNIVPAALADGLAQTVQNLHQFLVSQALHNVPSTGTHSFGELLNLAALPAAQQQTLLSLSINHTGKPEDFWKLLRTQPGFQQPGVVEKIQLTVQLGLLTRNHVPLIQQIQALNVSSPRALVKMDATAWLKLVNTQGVGLPPGVPGATPPEQARNYVNGIITTLRIAFPTDAMAQIAASAPSLPAQKAVAQFFANSPDFEIRTTRVDTYATDHAATAFQGISNADKPIVVQEVKRLQRVYQLSTGPDTATALLAANLDSAHDIANMPRTSFLARHAIALGGESQADAIYQRASHINARSLLVYSHVNEELNGIHPAATHGNSTAAPRSSGAHFRSRPRERRTTAIDNKAGPATPMGTGNGSQQVRQDLIKGFPNYAELFGSLDLCQCDQCRSVLSPAAYLVDLFEFLRNSTPNETGQTPLDVLLSRRPDVQYIPLTCENTNTALPYIDLVNEVLESYIALGLKLDQSAAYDTGDVTAPELEANPQHTNDNAYTALAGAVYPATLPFNQPVTVSRAYLANLGTSRYEIINTFQKTPDGLVARGTAAEYLGISREEYQVISGADFDPNGQVPVRAPCEFYGYPANTPSAPAPGSWEADLAHVPQFLARTGIAYTDLVQLVTTLFLNPSYPQGQVLATFLKIPISFATLTALVKNNFANPDPNVVAAVTDALGSWQALIDWSNANYQSVSKLIVLDAPDGSCDLDSTQLLHIDGSILTDPELSKLHRFIRLWRKIGWSAADLDRAWTALKAADITPDVITQLAQIQQIQSGLRIQNLQIVFTVWADINTRGDDALYKALFLNKAALNPDPAFVPNADGSVLTDNSQTISGHIPALLAALRVRAADLAAIRADAASMYPDYKGLDTDTAPLTLKNVSMVYRNAVIAQALNLRISDFLTLKLLSGINPFVTPDQTIAFRALASAVQGSGFSAAQLNYLYRHLSPLPASLAPQSTQVLSLARTLRTGLDQIAQDNVPTPDPAGELSRKKLQVLFDSASVEAAIGMINGSAFYAAPLAQLPAGVKIPDSFPDSVKRKVSYDGTTKRLRFQGAMATSEHTDLFGVSNDAAYLAAVNDLYQQPVTFISDTLSGFLDLNDATSNLVRNMPSLDQSLNPVQLDKGGNPTTDPKQAVTTAIATKFAYLLGRLLPYLTTQLSHALVKQTIADALKLDSAVAQALLESVLNWHADSSQPAIADFLSFATAALSSNSFTDYFTSSDLTGNPTVPASPVGATIPTGIQSVRWVGLLLATSSGAYTFSVQTNGKVQLWIDDVLQIGFQANPPVSAPVALSAGQFYRLRLEVTQLPAQNAFAELRWQGATVPSAPIPPENRYPGPQLDTLASTFTRTQKAALIVNTFNLNADEVAYLASHATDFGGFDLNKLPLGRDAASAPAIDQNAPGLFQSWRRVNAFVSLRNTLPQGQVRLINVFGATALADAQAELAQVTGWDPQVIGALAGPAGLNLAAADFKNEIALVRLQACIGLITRLGVSAAQLFAWADLRTPFAQLQSAVAPDIKKTVHGKYDPDTWLTVGKALNDPLRQTQRDALDAFLLPRMGLTDANQLFEYFLIDAEMCSCMLTSRIKQAISSVQLFVQRCLLNLESRTDPDTGGELGVAASAIDADQWQWMKQYSVWGANREVFLYPENWIEPALRDDKSPFFKVLESALLQNEVTSDNVEAAYLDYLQKLDGVARLEICGMYWEDVDPSTGETVNILHVFGRTRQQPRSHFYRRLLQNGVWTAWEPVTVDIQGDHLIPVIWNRRLILFWPTFSKTSDAPPVQNVDPTQPISMSSPAQYLQIGLAWSEYKQGKWSPKRVSGQSQALTGLTDDSVQQLDQTKQIHFGYVFKTELQSDLLIHAHCFDSDAPPPGLNLMLFETFDVGGCSGDTINLTFRPPSYPWDHSVVPTGADFDAMMYAESSGQQTLVMVAQDGSTRKTYLGMTPTPYKILYPHQCWPYTLQLPFFYQDSQRTYFAQPVQTPVPLIIASPNLIELGNLAGNFSNLVAIGNQMLRPISLLGGGLPPKNGSVSSGPALRSAVGTVPSASMISSATARNAGGSNRASPALFPAAAANSPLTLSSTVVNAGNWATTVNNSLYQWNVFGTQAILQMVPPWLIETTSLAFDIHYHPFVCEFMKALTRKGVPGLLTEANQTLGDPYRNSSWKLAFSGNVTSISENATGPACIIQGDLGAGPIMNFEAVVLEGNNLVHYWKDNSLLGFIQPWQRGEVVSSNAAGPGWLIQSDWINPSGRGNLEAVVLEGSKLVHYWRDQNNQWHADVNIITSSATGPGSLIQSDYSSGGHGRFEVVVLEGANLVHYWHDSNPNTAWQRAEVVTTHAASPGCIIQSDYLGANNHRNFEVVVCEGSGPGPYALVHYTFDGTSWNLGEVITWKATGAACLTQSDISDAGHGHFEVVVPEGNELVHYWRDDSSWYQGQSIPAQNSNAMGPACIIQSSFGKTNGSYGNLEVAALDGNRLIHYWNTTNEFELDYLPTSDVLLPYPVEDVDFRYTGAYSLYNWELFFHVPHLLATRLSMNRRHADATAWFHYYFNPTDDAPSEQPPGRYWKFLPFKEAPPERLMDMLLALDAGDPGVIQQVDDWRNHPFAPFRLARLRTSAFQKNVFMKYLDDRIAWADELFRQNTIESINQAQQLYVLAADLLGPRPQTLPNRGKPPAVSYADLIKAGGKLDQFSNAMVQLENEFPFSAGVATGTMSESGGLLGLSKTLFFCIPQNDKLLSYWDTVADRLFKIRHCMNIEGVVQQLPLFEPIVDPALLVQAVAQGVDLGSILSDLSAPLPYYRFSYVLQKALEVCAECRSFGGEILAALEKNDAEALALLRATRETNVQTAMQQIKSDQLAEAQDQVQALQKTRDVAATRYIYYQTMLTGTAPAVPAPGANIPPAPTPTQPTVAGDGSGTRLLQEEQSELDSSHSARDWQGKSADTEILASILGMLPDLSIDIHPFGAGTDLKWGSTQLWASLTAQSRQLQSFSASDTYDASHAGRMAGYFRRQQEWTLQSNLAAGEIMQIDQQITAANVRASIADYELNTLYPLQLQNVQDVQDFLTNKYTNQDLYTWMISDVSATFFQCYQLAYDWAKTAELGFRFQRGVVDSNFIQFGYWDSLHKGLQAGERLYLALKQMERAYHDQDRREYEITKRISLVLLNPLALIALKETGQCIVDLPELLFDTDYCGHYMRRIKSVSLTIPCVTGAYTSVNCTLTLLKSKIRIDPSPQPSYAEQDSDSRFVYNFAATQSVATSTAQNDSGMFEVNFRDERYLPFEGQGAISQWRLEMPQANNAFDFETISDVIINLSYTARDGGDPLRQAARNAIAATPPQDALRMFSLKHEFSNEWYRFLRPPDNTAARQVMSLDINPERFPFLFRGKAITVNRVELLLIFEYIYDPGTYKLDSNNPTPLGDYAKGNALAVHLTPAGNSPPTIDGKLLPDSSYGGVPHASLDLSNQPGGPGTWQLQSSDSDINAIAASLQTTVKTNGTTHFRLKADAIDDIVAVFHYSVS
jgi:hypothetical protein